ncbi:MAG: BREX-1 system adenine-specific DNA-methyltransferase PglX, partial [Bacteroidales bacterium]|nr:BREX-1 system adenine-specific DNA-methyltransferase PglX [Bacteroidales bacterium]
MDTNRLKRFATDARNSLMRGVEGALKSIGFNKDDGSFIEEPVLHGGGSTFMGVLKSEDFYWKWKALQHAVNVKSIREVKEEAAYTWFNRFVAIRILSKNGLISPQLEYQAENIRIPVIVTNARRGILPQIDDVKTWEKIQDLLRDDSKTDEQFRELIVAFCHSNKIIDKCFGAISDYTE